jgi:hypothetical protein
MSAPHLDDKLFLGSVKLDRLHDINVETRFSVRLNLREAPKQVSQTTRNGKLWDAPRVTRNAVYLRQPDRRNCDDASWVSVGDKSLIDSVGLRMRKE